MCDVLLKNPQNWQKSIFGGKWILKILDEKHRNFILKLICANSFHIEYPGVGTGPHAKSGNFLSTGSKVRAF